MAEKRETPTVEFGDGRGQRPTIGLGDICNVANLSQCMREGHDPLVIAGDVARQELTHTRSGITFAYQFFCKRCGLPYWEPRKPDGEVSR